MQKKWNVHSKRKLTKTEVTFKGKCYRMQEMQKNGMYIAITALIGKLSINHFLPQPFQKVRMVLPRLATYHYYVIILLLKSIWIAQKVKLIQNDEYKFSKFDEFKCFLHKSQIFLRTNLKCFFSTNIECFSAQISNAKDFERKRFDCTEEMNWPLGYKYVAVSAQ